MGSSRSDPVAVGLVGAGPWASMLHAPMLAAGPETHLSGVWARRPEAAQQLATAHHTVACGRFEELLDRSEAVAFAVPPQVQAHLAPRAARAGKALLLEKPIAGDLSGAHRLVDAVHESGVGSLVVLTARFTSATRAFLAAAGGIAWSGAQVSWISDALAEGPAAASPWRVAQGAIADLGPHALDLATAALGPVDTVADRRSEAGWIRVALQHQSGAVSEVTLSGHARGQLQMDVELAGPDVTLRLDVADAIRSGDFVDTIRAELAEVATTRRAHPCDVDRGLEVQALLAQVLASEVARG